MRKESNLSERILEFGVSVMRLTNSMGKTYSERHISGQLFRSATSAGANYEEACGAESRRDFVHKLQIVLKELRESVYWLKLLDRSGLENTELKLILNEASELTNIIGKSVVTTKRNSQ